MMKLTRLLTGLALVSASLAQKDCHSEPQILTYRDEITSGLVQAQFKTGTTARDLDWPRLSPRPNSTSWEGWSFDAVNPDNLKETFTISFMVASNDSTSIIIPEGIVKSNFAFLSYTLGNGDSDSILLAPAANEDGTVVITGQDGCDHSVSGEWKGVGASFAGFPEEGTSPTKEIIIKVSAPERGISGTFVLTAATPPTLPCTGDVFSPGQTLESSPYVGWAVSLPDANTVATFSFDTPAGTRDLKFSGIGYHDHFWSDVRFQQSIETMYMGHARLGPYSIVWHSTTAPGGKVYDTAYIAKDGELLYVKCDNTAANQENNLLVIESDDVQTKLTIAINGKVVATINVQKSYQNWPAPYAQYTGKASGEIEGTKQEGATLFYEYYAPANNRTTEEFFSHWDR